jgi:uncharacterized membrane protein
LNAGRLTAVGRWFFAIALFGLGAEHFVFQEFVTGRAPTWPDGVPGKLFWVYGSGVLVMSAALLTLVQRWGRAAALGLGLLVFAWALVRHAPVVAADSLLAGSWTRAGKALTLFGGSFALAATLPPIRAATTGVLARFANATGPYLRLGAICLGCFLIMGGLQHFRFTTFVVSLIPVWFPGNATWWTYFAGVALIAGGVGLLIPRTAPLAGLMSGLMVFSWFWIVHLTRTLASVSDGIAVFEALAVAGIAFVIAGGLVRHGSANERPTPPLPDG